jgi:hypothetical protein
MIKEELLGDHHAVATDVGTVNALAAVLREAVNPRVPFTGDLEEMRRLAEHAREHGIRLALALVYENFGGLVTGLGDEALTQDITPTELAIAVNEGRRLWNENWLKHQSEDK